MTDPQQGEQPDLIKMETETRSDNILQDHDPGENKNIQPKKMEYGSIPVIGDFAKETATVKVLVMPQKHVVTLPFTIGYTILDLKVHISAELKLSPYNIQITLNDDVVEDWQRLMDVGVQSSDTVQFEMSSVDPAKPLRPVLPHQERGPIDVITVKVQKDIDTCKDVVVEFEKTTEKKAFIGGYRNKLTKAEYHHASIQTIPKERPDKGIVTFCRDSQTVVLKNKYQQSLRINASQMTTVGTYVSNIEDKLVTPGTYVTAEEFHNTRLRAVIVLQSYLRRWLAKCFTEDLRRARELHRIWLENERNRKEQERIAKMEDDIRRKMHPEDKKDFEYIYEALNKWRKEEEDRIKSIFSGEERKAALCDLLKQETKIIAAVELKRMAANEKKHEMAIQAFLNKCAEPIKWKRLDGKDVQMETKFTMRGGELRDLYNNVTQTQFTEKERLDILLNVKQTVQEHKCKLTSDLMDLINREVDLIVRGMKNKNMEGLRRRISTLFLQYIKTPAFNPQVGRLMKLREDPAGMKSTYMCQHCNGLLKSMDFTQKTNSALTSLCQRCVDLDNRGRHRKNFSLYKNILTNLRKSENQCNPISEICFVLQLTDLLYLVDMVWGAQSALSSWKDLQDLVLVRWNKHLDWSPWNCILLRREEAEVHLKVESVETTYDVVFIRSVMLKHIMARKYFSQIPLMAVFMDKDENQQILLEKRLLSQPITQATK